MEKVINFEIVDGVALVALNRPQKMNALNHDLVNTLVGVGESIKANTQIRAVVLTGEGNNFCAGLDMEVFTAKGEPDFETRTHGITNLFQQVAWVWHEIPVPVIAAVEGNCLGGGLQIAMGADMRYIHPNARLSVMEIKWGLVPDMGCTALWGRFVSEDILKDLSFTGRVFSGAEAKELGLATRTTESPLEDAMAAAAGISNKNPDAVRALKRLINDQHKLDSASAMLAESREQARLSGTRNQMEAVYANIEKRAPIFSDPK